MFDHPDVHKKLTENSPAVKILCSLLDQAKFKKDSDLKSAYESNPIFYSENRLDSFRTRLNSLRKHYVDLQGTNFSIFSVLMSISDIFRVWWGTRKARYYYYITYICIEEAENEENYDNCVVSIEKENSDATILGFLLGARSFKLLQLLTEWEQPIDKTKMVPVAVLLPSGFNTGAWHMSMESGGSILELTVSWPVFLPDMKVLHSK